MIGGSCEISPNLHPSDNGQQGQHADRDPVKAIPEKAFNTGPNREDEKRTAAQSEQIFDNHYK